MCIRDSVHTVHVFFTASGADQARTLVGNGPKGQRPDGTCRTGGARWAHRPLAAGCALGTRVPLGAGGSGIASRPRGPLLPRGADRALGTRYALGTGRTRRTDGTGLTLRALRTGKTAGASRSTGTLGTRCARRAGCPRWATFSLRTCGTHHALGAGFARKTPRAL